jgi:5'-nucleotidase
VENYRATAEWGARFIAGLRARGLLLQHKFAVSINYPDISAGIPAKKAVWARVGTGVVALHSYVPQADGSYQISLGRCRGLPECEETRRDADAPAVLERNHIAVTPITWDRTYGTRIDGRRELAKVRAYVERHAPLP